MEVGKGSKANLFMACLFGSREEVRREGEEGRQKERKRGREAQAQENKRGKGLDIHFRIPPLGIQLCIQLKVFVMYMKPKQKQKLWSSYLRCSDAWSVSILSIVSCKILLSNHVNKSCYWLQINF